MTITMDRHRRDEHSAPGTPHGVGTSRVWFAECHYCGFVPTRGDAPPDPSAAGPHGS